MIYWLFFKPIKIQGHNFINQDIQENYILLKERFRYYMKEKQIRFDIIDVNFIFFSK